MSVVLVAAAGARTWNVKPDGTGDAPSIQAAIDSSRSGDVVEVDPGTYHETLLMTAKNIILRGRLGAEQTIIDAGQQSNVLQMDRGTVEGLTLRNGLAPVGAGVKIGQTGFTGTSIIQRCIIEDNRAGLELDSGAGGGISVVSGDVRIEENIIRNNSVLGVGGGIYDAGVGNVIANNVIAFNEAENAAGGIYSGFATIYGNLVVGNSGGLSGGGMFLEACAEMHNNTIFGNSISNGFPLAAGVVISDGCTVEDNLIANNHSSSGRGHGLIAVPQATLRCNDVWGNDVDTISGPFDPTNFSLDPQFCARDPLASMNFALQSDSPCRPNHAPSGQCDLVGASSSTCGIVFVKQSTWGDVKRLYR